MLVHLFRMNVIYGPPAECSTLLPSACTRESVSVCLFLQELLTGKSTSAARCSVSVGRMRACTRACLFKSNYFSTWMKVRWEKNCLSFLFLKSSELNLCFSSRYVGTSLEARHRSLATEGRAERVVLHVRGNEGGKGPRRQTFPIPVRFRCK